MAFIKILLIFLCVVQYSRAMDNSGNSTTTTDIEKIIDNIKGNNISLDNSGTSSTLIAVIIKNINLDKLTNASN